MLCDFSERRFCTEEILILRADRRKDHMSEGKAKLLLYNLNGKKKPEKLPAVPSESRGMK